MIVARLSGTSGNLSQKGSLLLIYCFLYVDNGAFTFEDEGQLERGLTLIYSHFNRFGLEIHIGRGEKASKTKFIFFTPPGFLGRNYIFADTQNEKQNISGQYQKGITH